MRYLTLSDAKKVVDWGRTLVTSLIQRDAAIDQRLKDIEARLTLGGL